MWRNLIGFLKRIDGKLTQAPTEHGLAHLNKLGNVAHRNGSTSNICLIRRTR